MTTSRGATSIRPGEASRVTVPLPPTYAPITGKRYQIQKNCDQQLLFYGYHSEGQAIARVVGACIEMVRSPIVRNRTDGTLIGISRPVYGNVPQTSEARVKSIQALYRSPGEYLPN